MEKTLYAAIMAGRNINGEVDGHKTDMPSWRVRVIFKDRDGKIVQGDIGFCAKHFTYGHEKEASHLYLSTDFQLNGVREMDYWNEKVMTPCTYRYLKAFELCRREPFYYSTWDILRLVSELTGEDYAAIEFVDKYDDWGKVPAVAELLAEDKHNEESIYKAYNERCEYIDRKREELAKSLFANLRHKVA